MRPVARMRPAASTDAASLRARTPLPTTRHSKRQQGDSDALYDQPNVSVQGGVSREASAASAAGDVPCVNHVVGVRHVSEEDERGRGDPTSHIPCLRARAQHVNAVRLDDGEDSLHGEGHDDGRWRCSKRMLTATCPASIDRRATRTGPSRTSARRRKGSLNFTIKGDASLLEPSNRSSRRHKYQLRVPHFRTDPYLHSYFPSAVRLLESVPTESPSVVTLPSFRSALKRWVEGQASNITTRISDLLKSS